MTVIAVSAARPGRNRLRAILALGITFLIVTAAAWLIPIAGVNLAVTSTIGAGCTLYGARSFVDGQPVNLALQWAGLLLVAIGALAFFSGLA